MHFGIALDYDGSIPDSLFYPVTAHLQAPDQLGQCEPARNVSWMRSGRAQHPMTLPKNLYGPREHLASTRRPVSLLGQYLGNLGVRQALAGQLEDPRLHLSAARKGMKRMHSQLDLLLGDLTTTPDNADVELLRCRAMQNDLLNQAT